MRLPSHTGIDETALKPTLLTALWPVPCGEQNAETRNTFFNYTALKDFEQLAVYQFVERRSAAALIESQKAVDVHWVTGL
ncbi:MAG: hypothetical protein ABSF26_17605 [Thermoguttaceae bacterium]|jgi:hypothetical protein